MKRGKDCDGKSTVIANSTSHGSGQARNMRAIENTTLYTGRTHSLHWETRHGRGTPQRSNFRIVSMRIHKQILR